MVSADTTERNKRSDLPIVGWARSEKKTVIFVLASRDRTPKMTCDRLVGDTPTPRVGQAQTLLS